jgi:hypothetical protein
MMMMMMRATETGAKGACGVDRVGLHIVLSQQRKSASFLSC